MECSGQTAPASPNWAVGGGDRLVDEKQRPVTWFPLLKFLGFGIRQLPRMEVLAIFLDATLKTTENRLILHTLIEFSVEFLKQFIPLF